MPAGKRLNKPFVAIFSIFNRCWIFDLCFVERIRVKYMAIQNIYLIF